MNTAHLDVLFLAAACIAWGSGQPYKMYPVHHLPRTRAQGI